MQNTNTIILIFLLLFAMIFAGCVYENHKYTPMPQTATTHQTNQTTPSASPPPTPTISPAPTFEIKEMYIKQNGTRLYEYPDNSSQITAVLNCGEIVTLARAEKEFYLIEYNNTKGYIIQDALTATPAKYTVVDMDNYEFKSPNIIVIKSLHILEVWDVDTLIFSCKAQVGKNEVGDKEKLGDKRTPEGEYYLCTLNPGSKYYKGIYISYPNTEDAQQAYENGTIDQNAMDRIIKAINDRKQPPYNTPLGGFISLHGEPNEEGYTVGCIVIENDYMDIIWDNCPIGTPITILP